MSTRLVDSRRRFLRFFGGLPAVGLLAGGDHRRHKVVPRRAGGLPAYPYRTLSPVPTASASSLPGLLILSPNPATPDVKFFQLRTRRVDLLHCSLSRAAMTIRRDGGWIASFVAEQNPIAVNPAGVADIVPLDSRGGGVRLTGHLLRNTFHVRLHALGADPGGAEPDPGPPELARIDLPAFVVERGAPFRLRRESSVPDAAIRMYFPLIHSFEVDFSIS